MALISMVILLFLPYVLVYFLLIAKTFLRLEIKNKLTGNNNNLLNHQNDLIYFRYDGDKALDKEQTTVQSTLQSTVQPTVQPTVQSTVQSTFQHSLL